MKLQRRDSLRLGLGLLLLAASPAELLHARPAMPRGPYPGAGYRPRRRPGAVRPRRRFGGPAETLRYWNQVAIDASGLDHTPPAAGENRPFGEQLGPGRASRAIAMVQIAVFDAVNSILGGYEAYTRIGTAPRNASVDAAIAQAAHDVLVEVFPAQSDAFAELLAGDLPVAGPPQSRRVLDGRIAGARAAAAILALREHDGSHEADPLMGSDWHTSNDPGRWRQDPVSLGPVALGAKWGKVRPFVLASPAQFRAPPPPDLGSEAYALAFEEAKALGGDGIVTPTVRTAEQTHIGTFWAYDGTPSLCAPPRLYNQIIAAVSARLDDVRALARLYALANAAMADAGIACWESKFHYDFWRPVTGIREADPGTGPTGLGDGNPLTRGDPGFTPLGAPASNLTGPNFTPPFPSYPSGHATFGGTLFQVLRRFYGTDRFPFSFVSDEFNGETVGNDGQVRPWLPRQYGSFSEAEEENGQSRIYLGIHWAFDKTEGISQGRRVADWAFDRAFRPKRR